LSRITSQNRNAYRAELLGLLAALYIIQYVEEEYLETEGSISLVSDCGNALKRAFRRGPIGVKDATQDEFDIILGTGIEDDYLHPPVITVLHNNVPLTRGLPQQIITDVHYDPLKRKLQKDNGWTEETFLSVDWSCYHKAILNIPRPHQLSISELCHNLLNKNYQNQKYYHQD
jgi:hypothetical protein